MKVEVFLKNGSKVTIDKVHTIKTVEKNIFFDYEKEGSGDFTTCDMPSVGFPRYSIDMLKVVKIDE